ncbi:radical SAM (seleno)protein TrsS [Pseudodesulfovibrio sp. zrk46]|uniref:radical SAM (seleno)protein TrsS n=1 Tax=Pseudodesulfovibrio sp. zrk46 TaxID=2725288 RepID=UPI001448B7DB|nr:radical SAM (seleno)protein TrsS [Pseudodesulfovibrio sp. zrk46]QJB57422.1 radical SAM protein [Pseudodesulfovibrio sp. zrk46]
MSRIPRSVCPVCLRPIPASHETVGDETFIVKACPDHGEFRTVVWRGSPDFSDWSRTKIPSLPRKPFTRAEKGCPMDCGLCDGHRQHTCTAVLEITQRCNLSCPVCFASSGKGTQAEPDVDKIDFLLDRVLESSGRCNLQLSGGEPTVRADLDRLIRLAKNKGFPFVQLNSNGLRFAHEDGFAEKMAQVGLDSVFLQFDGTENDIYQELRGQPLLDDKLRAISNLMNAGIGIVLVPTVVPGVNDSNLGAIIQLASKFSPGVRGVHFQPVSYFGRYPDSPQDNQRITLPEIMRLLECQTHGAMRASHFTPPGCEHSHCSFHANYVVSNNGKLTRLGTDGKCGCTPRPASEGADKAKAFVKRQWTAPMTELSEFKAQDDLDRFISRAASHTLAISAMAFQDCWTLDLERLKGCCIHEVAPDGRLIPFCAYNLTSMSGEALYRGKAQ